MRASQLVGLLLWRTGLLIVGSYSLIRIAKFALLYVEWPTQVEIGVSLALAGAVLVAVSFVAERVLDMRVEGDLGE